jgi:hypothetical protein
VRSLAPTFVTATPSGARIRTRLRLTPTDEAVLAVVGRHLGTLAGRDLAARCRGDTDRTRRKRELTAASSSRWAGALTRTSNDQWERGFANLLDRRAGLRRACRKIRARLAVPVGQRYDEVRGYASQIERFQKQRRLQHLLAALTEVDLRLAERRVSVCRGGRRLTKLRHGLDNAELSAAQWHAHWEAERLFLTADGEADKHWGNETIRVHPDQHWLEIRLPSPLADLSNTSGRTATYRLACPVAFTHRADEWAAQAASGPVRYDIRFDPARSRWYLDACWRLPARAAPSLAELRQHRALGVDLNADHLDCWVLDPSGNPVGPAHTIPMDLHGPASTRDGRLRTAVSTIVRLAIANRCRSIVVENLDFTDARQAGRETLGRGQRGKSFRRTIAGMPTRRFRDLMVGMAANAGLWIVAVDPGWTSKWGQRYWWASLAESSPSPTTPPSFSPWIIVTRHHAAAVVIGRRGLGFGARRRPGCARLRPADRGRRATGRASMNSRAVREPSLREANGRRTSPRKTRLAEPIQLGDQAVQDRSEPPGQDLDLPTS